jgi:toxin ParE1/3/4
MTFRQTILPEAQADFDEGVRWYAKEKKGRGRKFAEAVKQVLKRLRKMPKAHTVVMKDVRRALVPGFPYIVLYRVTDDEVVIISIFHTSQDPYKWQSRV